MRYGDKTASMYDIFLFWLAALMGTCQNLITFSKDAPNHGYSMCLDSNELEWSVFSILI